MRTLRLTIATALLAGCHIGNALADGEDPRVVPAPVFGEAIEDDAASWHILGLPPGRTLNMRSGPGSSFRVIATLPEALPVRRFSCQERLGEYWCRVATMGAPRISGWVNGRYVSDEFIAPAADDGR